MTTIDFDDLPVGDERHISLFARLGTAFARWREHSRRRRMLGNISHLNAYLLRDIGLSPDDIARADGGPHRSIWLEPLSRQAK